jgi:hypothetical protein
MKSWPGFMFFHGIISWMVSKMAKVKVTKVTAVHVIRIHVVGVD